MFPGEGGDDTGVKELEGTLVPEGGEGTILLSSEMDTWVLTGMINTSNS